jgi:hypothetical protein
VAVTRPTIAALALGTTQSFAVLAGSTVTNTGPTVVTGDLGVSPGDAVTGFPPGLVSGGTTQAGSAVALQAELDATTAYDALAAQACNRDLTGQDLGGMTLTPGTYCFSSSAQLTGALTLDAQGNPAAVFVFQIGSTLTTASSSSVRMLNGGTSCSVYWQVGSSATLGTGTRFTGSIIALTSITLTTGASVSGRAVARNGAVTLDTNTVSVAGCNGGSDGGMDGAVMPGNGGGAGAGGAAGATGSAGGGAAGSGVAGVTGIGAGGIGAVGAGGAGAGAAGAGGIRDSGVGGVAGTGVVVGADAACTCDATCGCRAGTTSCAGTCVDLSKDSMHCGSCDLACGAAESCVDGVCCPGPAKVTP